MNSYEDIINLVHYVSKRHPRMRLDSRAAQFASFAALTGYEDEIMEVGRETNKKIILSDDEREVINSKILDIKENIRDRILVKITYFVRDLYKEGGDYYVICGVVKRIDEYNQVIIMDDKMKILMEDVIDIERIKFD